MITKSQSTVISEEKRSIIWFLILFYIITFSYDFVYYYVLRKYVFEMPFEIPYKAGYLVYLVLLALFGYAWYLLKNDKHQKIKYIYFISYTLIILLDDLYMYLGTSHPYETGNAVEIFLILFSPIFVSRRYYWLVVNGTLLKYLIIGISLHTTDVLYPIILVIVLALIAYIFLNRFIGYVEAIEDSFDKQLQGIVKGVIATLELKDPYTKGHSERVAYYGLEIAKELDLLDSKQLKEFNYACLLHDVGKIHIPDQVLMKPARLTAEEFDIIKTHPVVGADALAGVEGLSEGINVIRSHHERWDGKGYPDQLCGQEIPQLARIASIADAFDAMTSSRSYRDAIPLEEAYQRIIDGKGSQFDPDLIEVFKKVFPKWESFHKNYNWYKTKRNEVL